VWPGLDQTGKEQVAAMDGETGSQAMRAEALASLKRDMWPKLRALAEAEGGTVEAALSALARPDARFRVAHPFNEMSGVAAFLANVWTPLKDALPDMERRDSILVAGDFEGRTYLAAMGHHCGTFERDLIGIPATGAPVQLRYGEVYRIEDGRIVEANLLWDFIDLMRQADCWPLPPPLGVEAMWPAPITGDGIVLAATDPAQSAASIAQTLAMHATLAGHDDRNSLTRDSLLAMPQRDHWHPKMMWHGPAGIGTTRGLAGFVDHHQLPFRIAFQRPQGSFEEVMAERARHGAGHYVRIGDGPYSVTGGWPSVYAIHGGGGFCGTTPTNRPVFMRVMDFYLHHEGLIRENWVPLDMLHLFQQMGYDVLARMRAGLKRRP
jgi:predicted ester cyclase